MLYDGDRDDDVRASTATWPSAPRPGCTALGVGADVERVVAAAHVDGVGGARRRAVPARRGAEPDAADLPRTARSRSSRSRRTASCSITPSVWNNFDYAGARRAGRGRAATACTRSSPTTATPTAIRRRCRRRPRVSDDPGRRSGALDLLHVGHDRRAEGRAAHRPLGARRRDRLREEDARGRRRHRARRVPVHARRRDHHRRVHAAAHRLGRGAHGGVDAAGVDRAHRASTASRSRNGAAAIHAALHRRGEGRPRRVHDGPRLPERRFGEAAAAARRPEGGRAVEHRHDVGLRHDRGADRLADRHRRARRREALRRGPPERGRDDQARRPRRQRGRRRARRARSS